MSRIYGEEDSQQASRNYTTEDRQLAGKIGLSLELPYKMSFGEILRDVIGITSDLREEAQSGAQESLELKLKKRRLEELYRRVDNLERHWADRSTPRIGPPRIGHS